MQFNVATLLQEAVGSARSYTVEDEPVVVPDDGYQTRASGRVHLLRTQNGILVSARLTLDAEASCARCLEAFALPVEVDFAEEFVARNPVTGVRPPAEPDQFIVDDRHMLDLSEAIRQYEQTALPLQPRCREDCAGLCPVCGANRNDVDCGCATDSIDDRWGALAGLAERMHAEDADGAPEA